MYPPAWVVGRSPLHKMQIGGHTLEKKSIVLMSQIVVQRDARWFKDPLAFKPERWETKKSGCSRKVHLPSAADRAHALEISLRGWRGRCCLRRFRAGFTFDPVLDRAEPQPLITLRPRSGMPVKIHKRK